MRFAYADPPYLGCCSYYEHDHGDDGHCWDDIATHAALIDRLRVEYPDGWAMSLTTPSLRHILPLCPDGTRVGAWVKPFASFKPGIGVAYAWEPVLFWGGRQRARGERTERDWVAENITLQRGFTGAKPAAVIRWVMSVLNVQPGDTVDDLFVGSGAVTEAINGYFGRLPVSPSSLFDADGEPA